MERQGFFLFEDNFWELFSPTVDLNATILTSRSEFESSEIDPSHDIVFSSMNYVSMDRQPYPSMREEMSRLAACVLPSEGVASIVREHSRSPDLANAVGIHVRRGDLLVAGPANRARIVEMEDYFRHIDMLFPNEDLFVCAEDLEIVRSFEARYGERVIPGVSRGFNRDSQFDLMQAYADIILLSRCAVVLGGVSAFNRAAAVIGGKPLLQIRSGAEAEQGNARRILSELTAYRRSDLIERLRQA